MKTIYNKKAFLIFFLTIWVVIPCLLGQTEHYGDKKLKSKAKPVINHYLGFAESNVSFDEAYESAFQKAQSMISQELGVTINTHTKSIATAAENDKNVNLSFYIESEVIIDSEHDVRVKVESLYYEKSLSKKGENYKVWVELFFDVEGFYRQYNEFWRKEMDAIKNLHLIAGIERVHRLNPKYEKEKRYLTHDIQRDYDTVYLKDINTISNNIEVQASNKNKFSNDFSFQFFDKNSRQICANLPINISGQKHITNAEGRVTTLVDYQRDVEIFIGHELLQYLPRKSLLIYHNDSFTPYVNRNVNIFIDAQNSTVKTTFENFFIEKGFQINKTPDITLVVKVISRSKQLSINEYFTELRYEIVINNNKYYIPSEQNEFSKGYGLTEQDAFLESCNLKWHTNKEQDINKVIAAIREFLSKCKPL
ncbi:MAG: hypothetical protein FWG20_03750 [Candidatus Cloacimonetes bacterium]|nr:hypothetical protein [Candidatus Cloacimonadota bacterium]